ncbi:MAG: hypothetical protein ACE37F_13820 [Nannocystaceae bacterium]|nr:hypothetical protein [bacterium]
MDPDNALSLETIRSAAETEGEDAMAFEAMWASIGWMFPVQTVGLYLGGVGVFASVGVAVALSVGLAFASPFAAGIVAAFVDGAMADRIAWALMVAAAAIVWVAMGGPVVAAALALCAVPLFLVLERRYRDQEADPQRASILPDALHERLAGLPEGLPESVSAQIDRALTSVESLHELRAELPEGDVMWTDALACTERVVDRAEASLQLHRLPQRSEEIERAKQAIDAQLRELADQLAAVVDAGSRFIALDRDGLEVELSERAESLHALVEATHEVDDALR